MNYVKTKTINLLSEVNDRSRFSGNRETNYLADWDQELPSCLPVDTQPDETQPDDTMALGFQMDLLSSTPFNRRTPHRQEPEPGQSDSMFFSSPAFQPRFSKVKDWKY